MAATTPARTPKAAPPRPDGEHEPTSVPRPGRWVEPHATRDDPVHTLRDVRAELAQLLARFNR